MAPQLGSKIKPEKVAAATAPIQHLLHPDEEITLLLRATSLRPLLDWVGITPARIVAWQKGQPSFKSEAIWDDVASCSCERGMTGHRARVVLWDGREVNFGNVSPEDVPALLDAMRRHQSVGPPAELRATAQAAATAAGTEASAQKELLSGLRSKTLLGTTFIGPAPFGKASAAIAAHCRQSERPWLVIHELNAGVLAAFKDRLIIVKTGAVTGFMTGSLGGGRTTIFPFAEITGIEYNAGILTGVLEILTPSYQGSRNHDFWRGTHKSRNADAGDPFTLSNTLPLAKTSYKQAQPQLIELQRLIAEAKQVRLELPSSPVSKAGPNLAGQLRELAALRDQGLLSEEEFATAKARLLA